MSRPNETARETIVRLEGALRRQGETNEAQRLRIKELERFETEDNDVRELVRILRELASP